MKINRCNMEGTTDVLRHDLVRMSSGLEYEYILKEQLRNHNVLFLSEAAARSEGLSKTPDVVLQFPISIFCSQYPFLRLLTFLHRTGWKEINWIESKALRGDEYWYV